MNTLKNPVSRLTYTLAGKAVLGLPSLQEIVAVLNGESENPGLSEPKPEITKILRELVQRWKDFDWDVQKLCDSQPGLEEALQKLCAPPQYIAVPQGGARLVHLFVGPVATTHLAKDPAFKDFLRDAAFKGLKGGDAFRKAFRGKVDHEAVPKDEQALKDLVADYSQYVLMAIQYFGALTLIDWQKLGGPCARCKRYYIKRRASQRTYCSRRCGNAATATLRTAEQREREREANLQRADKAIQQWKRTGKQTNWKEFVSRKTGLTPKWLTRAVGRNDLKAPKEEL